MSNHPSDIDSITVSDVEHVSSTGWDQLNDDKKTYLLGKAKRKIRGQWSRRQSNINTIEGDRVDATILAAAHAFEIAEGGEAQSQSSQGGNVSFNTVTGEWYESLSETRFGRELRDDYLMDQQGISMVRTR